MNIKNTTPGDGYLYSVGSLFDNTKTSYDEEGFKIEIRDDGIQLLVYYNDPTKTEKQELLHGDFKIGFVQLNSVLFFSSKIGKIPTQTSPFTTHFAYNLTNIPYPSEGKGLPLTIMLINTKNGILELMRTIGLGNNFSHKLLDLLQKQSSEPFDIDKYLADIQDNYAKYTDDEIQKLSTEYFKIKAK